jgi:predicted MPP superfamily phosphohydrolase
MFYLLFLTLFFLGNALQLFLIKESFGKGVCKKDFLYTFLFSIFIFVSIIIFRNYFFEVVRAFYFYLGFLNFISIASIFYFITKTVLFILKIKINKIFLSRIFLFLAIFFTALSSFNFFSKIEVVEYIIESNKVSREYRFVQVNDIQYGTVTKEYFEKVVDLVEEQDPEFVVFVGDLVDFEGYKEDDFKILEKIKSPIYFERGNHEFYHFPEKLIAYLEKVSNVNLLINKKEAFGEIDITGIDYERDQERYGEVLKEIPLDKNRYNILIYHEPKNVEVSLEHGFDLLLYGHTHAGQIWPFTEVVDLMYEYADGFFKVGDSFVHTSDGAALWGPRMRLGSQNEIVLFTVKPE